MRPEMMDCRFKEGEGVQSLPQLPVVLGAMSTCHGMAAKPPRPASTPAPRSLASPGPAFLPRCLFPREPGQVRPQSYILFLLQDCPSSSFAPSTLWQLRGSHPWKRPSIKMLWEELACFPSARLPAGRPRRGLFCLHIWNVQQQLRPLWLPRGEMTQLCDKLTPRLAHSRNLIGLNPLSFPPSFLFCSY